MHLGRLGDSFVFEKYFDLLGLSAERNFVKDPTFVDYARIDILALSIIGSIPRVNERNRLYFLAPP